MNFSANQKACVTCTAKQFTLALLIALIKPQHWRGVWGSFDLEGARNGDLHVTILVQKNVSAVCLLLLVLLQTLRSPT